MSSRRSGATPANRPPTHGHERLRSDLLSQPEVLPGSEIGLQIDNRSSVFDAAQHDVERRDLSRRKSARKWLNPDVGDDVIRVVCGTRRREFGLARPAPINDAVQKLRRTTRRQKSAMTRYSPGGMSSRASRDPSGSSAEYRCRKNLRSRPTTNRWNGFS